MSNILKLIFITCFVSVSLGEIYQLFEGVGGSLWIRAAVVHSALAIIVLIQCYRIRTLKSLMGVKTSVAAYLPFMSILAFILLVMCLSQLTSGAVVEPFQNYWISLVLWVPLIEELVFRVGFGSTLRKIGGVTLGSYFSVILFALVHSMPSVSRILEGNIFLPLGPLLLASVCEYVYVRYGKLLPIVLFHMACNSTVIVISSFDARWFKWLYLLY